MKNKKQMLLKEVRIPRGFFLVLDSFNLPGFDGWDIVFNKGEILSIEPDNKIINVYNNNKDNWIEKKINFSQFMQPNIYREFAQNVERLSQSELNKLTGQETSLKFTTTIRALDRRIKELDLDPSTRIKVEILIEKLEKLTNKKIKLVETETEIIYPNKLPNYLKQLDNNLSNFDIQQIKHIVLKMMASGKIIDKKALKLIINSYKNNIINAS